MLYQVEVFSIGVTIRDHATNALLCDFPSNSLKTVHDLAHGLFKFELVMGTSIIGIALQDSNLSSQFTGQLLAQGISCKCCRKSSTVQKRCFGVELPVLTDPTTQVWSVATEFR